MPIIGFESACSPQQSIIISSDVGSRVKHTANNVDRDFVNHYHIDGYVITEGQRCDYLLLDETKSTAYLIELKGTDLTHAVEQLEATEKVLHCQLEEYETIYYRVICKRIRAPKIESNTVRAFKRKHSSTFRYCSGQMEESI